MSSLRSSVNAIASLKALHNANVSATETDVVTRGDLFVIATQEVCNLLLTLRDNAPDSGNFNRLSLIVLVEKRS